MKWSGLDWVACRNSDSRKEDIIVGDMKLVKKKTKEKES